MIRRFAYSLLSCVWPIRSGYDVVRILAAIVLLTAAGLKAHQLATEPVLAKTWIDSRWVLMVAVEFELFFGVWLLSNNLPRLTWLVAIGCFSLFTFISVWKALAGYGSCGCFGSVKVNPWFTATLDLAFVASLLFWRPRYRVCDPGRRARCNRAMAPISLAEVFHRTLFVLVVWFSVGIPAGCAMASYSVTTLSDVGSIVGNGDVVVIEPEKWLGKRVPLLPFIEDCPVSRQVVKQLDQRPLRDHLIEGEWFIVLYYRDCQRCRTAISFCEQLAKQAVASQTMLRVALIEIPTSNTTKLPSVSTDTCCVFGRLSSESHWFTGETPLGFMLSDGCCCRIGYWDLIQQLMNKEDFSSDDRL